VLTDIEILVCNSSDQEQLVAFKQKRFQSNRERVIVIERKEVSMWRVFQFACNMMTAITWLTDMAVCWYRAVVHRCGKNSLREQRT